MHVYLGTLTDPIRVFPLMRVRIRLFTLMLLHRIRIRIRLFTLLRIRTWILLLIKWCEWLYFEPLQFLILKLICFRIRLLTLIWIRIRLLTVCWFGSTFHSDDGSATLWGEPFTLPRYLTWIQSRYVPAERILLSCVHSVISIMYNVETDLFYL